MIAYLSTPRKMFFAALSIVRSGEIIILFLFGQFDVQTFVNFEHNLQVRKAAHPEAVQQAIYKASGIDENTEGTPKKNSRVACQLIVNMYNSSALGQTYQF